MFGVEIVDAIGEREAEAGGSMAFLVVVTQVARFANELFEWFKLRHSCRGTCESIEQIQAFSVYNPPLGSQLALFQLRR